MDIELIKNRIRADLSLTKSQVDNVVEMLDEGSTIPFIARYRKERTGSMTDEVLRSFDEKYNFYKNFYERLDTIVSSIEEQGLMTDEIKASLYNAKTMSELEDIYRPFKPKRKTRASVAKAKGLEGLASYLLAQKDEDKFDETVESYLTVGKEVEKDKAVNSKEEALQGARDIIAEMCSDNADYRKKIRENTSKKGIMHTTKAKDEEDKPVFEMYYEYQEAVSKIPTHRILAMNRGENTEILKVNIIDPREENIALMKKDIVKTSGRCAEQLNAAIEDGYDRLIKPSIENEVRSELTEKAETVSIEVFKANLKELLLEAPTKGKRILGFDPGFRTGCKMAIVDENGKPLWYDVAHAVPLGKEEYLIKDADKIVKALIEYKVDLISLGNGTASRESEAFFNKYVFDRYPVLKEKVDYVITNEAGASVYSASKLGIKEFPNLDVTIRGAISLARRVQDPLAELVKIDPKSIGVGQYQHDMNQKHLSEALGGVVEGCVNQVGVNLNNASTSILTYISGINSTIAQNIVDYRNENGAFKDRKELLKVAKLGPKAYEQCAGFLRIEGKNKLDNTGVHPESYDVAKRLLEKIGYSVDDIGDSLLGAKLELIDIAKTSKELGCGEETLKDIIVELQKPGRDIRDLNVKVKLRNDVTSIEDLKEGMVLDGTVRNIVDFGAFVDIGVHQDGLVHLSQLSNKFVKHPLDVVKIGQIVKVKVISVDAKKKKIGLSMKDIKE
jgi:uncharacterized protein